jgi:hypothetical protein
MVRWLIGLVLLLPLFAAACAPDDIDVTDVPTLTLIPATATDTATPIPPSPTPADLPAPADILNPTLMPTLEGTAVNFTGQELIERDPVAAQLVTIARRLVATDLDLPIRLVRLIDVRLVVWTDSTLNCPPPNSENVPQQVDGYRIVVRASDQTYLFHTDFNHVVPCDPANEQLPEGVVLPTEEATAELTLEATEAVTAEASEEAS